MKCPHCNAPAEAGDLFCVECGQSLSTAAPRAEAPPGRKRRRLILFVLLLVLLMAVGLTAAFFLDLLALPPALTTLFVRPVSETTIKSTRQPFMVVVQSGANAADVVAVDLEGNLLTKLGSSQIAANQAVLQITDPDYPYWPRWPIPPGISPAAYAWPDSSAAVVALADDNRWDLLLYDAARGEVAELAQGVQLYSVVGHNNQDHFLAHFSQQGGQSLVAAQQQASTGIILLDGQVGSLDYALSPDGEHSVYVADSLFVAQVNGERVNRQPGDYEAPVFSLDGKELFYSNGRQLIRAGADGRQAQVIAEVGSNSELRPLSAGTSHLAVGRNLNGESSLVIMTFDGKITAQLGPETELEPPLFLQDGKGLLVTERDSVGRRLILSDVKGKEARTLVDEFSNVFVLPLRDNEHLVIVTVGDDGFGLALDDLRTKTTQDVEQGLDQLWPLASDARSFVYAAQDDGSWSLRALSFDDGMVQELDAGAFQGYPSAFFLPDGKHVLYEARGEFTSSADTQADGSPVLQYGIEGGVYRVALDDPKPELVIPNAFLLAASLAR